MFNLYKSVFKKKLLCKQFWRSLRLFMKANTELIRNLCFFIIHIRIGKMYSLLFVPCYFLKISRSIFNFFYNYFLFSWSILKKLMHLWLLCAALSLKCMKLFCWLSEWVSDLCNTYDGAMWQLLTVLNYHKEVYVRSDSQILDAGGPRSDSHFRHLYFEEIDLNQFEDNVTLI